MECCFILFHVFLLKYWGFSPFLFYNSPTNPLSLEVISARPHGNDWVVPVSLVSEAGLLQSTTAAGEMGVITVAALAQSPMWILCP